MFKKYLLFFKVGQMKRVFFTFSLCFFALFGCGEDKTLSQNTPSSCDHNVAKIGIHDNFLETICGCGRNSAKKFFPGDNLNCNIDKKTTLFFHYLALNTPHQIVSKGKPNFTSSPPFKPKAKGKGVSLTHAVSFSKAGDFSFFDSFEKELSGTIQVQ